MVTVAISWERSSSTESMPTSGPMPPLSAIASFASLDDARCQSARAADSWASMEP